MLTREENFIAEKQISELRRNPPRPTAAHYAEGKAMELKERARQKKEREQKAKSTAHEIKEMSKSVAEHFHTRCTSTIKFHGYGEGKVKKLICVFCGEHCSDEWLHIGDGWYGKEHEQFARLTKSDQKRERVCLLQRKT